MSEVISKSCARRFLLLKQGLLNDYIFEKKAGALAYVKQAGCIQFDPIDVVGMNAELTLQSRVKGFKKQDLKNLLYKDRLLFDYVDKELSILPIEDWPQFNDVRAMCKENGKTFEGLKELEEEALAYIEKKGPVSSASLPLKGEIYWHSSMHWSGNWQGKSKASRSVLEQLYTTGELIIHHKEGSRKYYDLSRKHLPQELLNAKDPFDQPYTHNRWQLKRRIGAVGLLWNKNSMAFLGIRGLDTTMRDEIFKDLLNHEEIMEIHVEGIREAFYLLKEDEDLLKKAKEEMKLKKRMEFLAPLDPMLWDRQLIEKIFGFEYSWEIYTPKKKRKYGYYVLPVLYEDRLIGRIEPFIEGDALKMKGIWLEKGVRKSKKLERVFHRKLKAFARFNDCFYEESALWN